jgi:ABC-type dipeptide/oligopeptide/nickel transport system permease subunit
MSATFSPATMRRLRAAALRVNVPLIIGGLLIAVLALCAVAAPLIAPHDPLATVFLFNGKNIIPAPYPPGTPGLPLGSDTLWRDMLSRLIYGCRYTLLFCGVAATLRIAIGAALGMLAGWYPRASRAIDIVVSVWSAVPSLFFAIVPILIVNRSGSLAASTATFVIVLGLTGWAETATRCRVAVRGLSAQPFVESAYAIGLRRGAVLWRHILPNLRDLLVIEAAYAMAAVLLLVGELGFLGVVVGGSLGDKGVGSVNPIYAEWGSMLAKGLRDRGSGLWLLLEPLIAFTIAILAFNLLAEGLRRRQ